LPNKVIKIILKKESREELIQRHISKTKCNVSIVKHITMYRNQHQEGDK